MNWAIRSWFTLAGQVVMLVLAIRLYRQSRSRASVSLMWACICFVVARSAWFTVNFVAGLFEIEGTLAGGTMFHLQDHIELTFELFFVAFMIVTLILLLRDEASNRI